MQTTLRIDDEIYREAKAQAALEGVTLTRYLESALLMKLGKPLGTPAGTPHSFATYTPERPLALTNEELRQFTQEDELRHDLRILGSGRAEG
jgi:hypothetical protein